MPRRTELWEAYGSESGSREAGKGRMMRDERKMGERSTLELECLNVASAGGGL